MACAQANASSCASRRRREPVDGIRLAIDEQTLKMYAVEVTGSNAGDAAMLQAANEILRTTRYPGRAPWRRWSDYHR